MSQFMLRVLTVQRVEVGGLNVFGSKSLLFSKNKKEVSYNIIKFHTKNTFNLMIKKLTLETRSGLMTSKLSVVLFSKMKTVLFDW